MNIFARQVSMREAILLARRAGISVEPVHRTGEIVFAHPAYPRRVRVNGRRKDCPREVLTLLRRIAQPRSQDN